MKNSWLPLIKLSLVVVLATPAVHAESIELGNIQWTPTGTAGVIAGDNTVPNSPTANLQFGYVSTDYGAYGTSPLVLKDEGRGSENQTNGTKIVSSTFAAGVNDTLTLYFNYVSTDGRGYDDYAWARLVKANTSDSNNTAAWLFTARSTNSANGNVVPGNVLKRQTDDNLPSEIDAVLNGGNTVDFSVTGTEWAPLGYSSGICWDSANTCGPTGWIKSSYTVANSGTYFLEFGVNNWGDQAYDSALAFDFAGLQRANFADIATPVPEPEGYALILAGLAVVGVAVKRKRRDLHS